MKIIMMMIDILIVLETKLMIYEYNEEELDEFDDNKKNK